MSHYTAPQTWVLVCNGAHAKLFINRGPKHSVDQTDEAGQTLPAIGKLLTKGRGRHQPPGNMAENQAFERPNPREMEKTRFLKDVAHTINRRAERIRRLIVIAPPKALHVLRGALSPAVREKIISEVDKDLTKSNARSLPRFLKKHLNLRDPVNEFNYEQARLFTAT